MGHSTTEVFKRTVKDYYAAYGRVLPWREAELSGQFDSYKILLSEIMLQQTQVQRVIPKFALFLSRYPTIQELAAAPLASILRDWSGLGYNRRAKYLWQVAQIVVEHYNAQLPHQLNDLETLPGIGHNTAAAIAAYAFNQPVVFIETNIRSVYIHHFFPDEKSVADKVLLPLIALTLDRKNPRLWYWALMDYGSYLKSQTENPGRRSAQYIKQSPFQGSRRQLRGAILKVLGQAPQPLSLLTQQLSDVRLLEVLTDLVQEGFIEQTGTDYCLKLS